MSQGKNEDYGDYYDEVRDPHFYFLFRFGSNLGGLRATADEEKEKVLRGL